MTQCVRNYLIMSNTSTSIQNPIDEDKRVRRLYQALLERRPLKYWSILDFPYLAEIVRHDATYLRRILSFIFVDHPALSQYLTLIAWREMSREINKTPKPTNVIVKYEMLPIGFERTLWIMYKRQMELSDLWSSSSEAANISCEELPPLGFSEFISKISGLSFAAE